MSSASAFGRCTMSRDRCPSEKTAVEAVARRPDGKFSGVAAVRPSNRQQAIEDRLAFEGIQWKLTPANYGSGSRQCAQRLQPDPALVPAGQGQPGGARRIPCCLGMPRLALANSGVSGSSWNPWPATSAPATTRGDVAGVDCSAFVSAAWGLSVHYTTAAIPAIAKPVENPVGPEARLMRLNKPGSRCHTCSCKRPHRPKRPRGWRRSTRLQAGAAMRQRLPAGGFGCWSEATRRTVCFARFCSRIRPHGVRETPTGNTPRPGREQKQPSRKR